jgi:hypothetical protein
MPQRTDSSEVKIDPASPHARGAYENFPKTPIKCEILADRLTTIQAAVIIVRVHGGITLTDALKPGG